MEDNYKKSSQEDIVKTLMKTSGEQQRAITAKENVPFFVFICPKRNLCSDSSAEVIFQKNYGYSNPYKNIKSCLAGSNQDALIYMYYAVIRENNRTGF